ncbi:MAG TPA: GAF domain-containing protein, partial [Gammaproteobacteria bacterium]|nr:GAF domain-containing protein [Gammaproteobacteria bacterium]
MPSFTGLSPNSAALESVLWTEDLWRRPSRPADHAAENRALVAVASEMAIRPDGVLQRLAEVALELCGAHSAGLSILEEENGRQVFRWQAAAGQWAPLRGGTMPREFSPCGTVLDRRSMELMVRPDRHFLPLVGVEPLIEELLLIPFRVGGETVGTIWLMAHDGTRRFDAEDLRLMTNLGNFASACLTMESLNATAAAHRDLQRTAAALRESEERLAMELADMAKLQEISTHILSPGDVDSLHDAILEAAVDVMRSDMGSMQLYHPDRGELQLLAQRGFHPESTKFWEWVRVESGSTCGAALRARKRVIAADIDTCDFILGTPDYDSYRLSGITAVQTTPLLSRSGRLLGMISNHWRKPHNPSQRDLRMLDVIARLAADLLERRQAESALKEADRRKDEFLATLAHELRNPLSPLTTGLEILKLGKDGAAFERTHAMMERQVGQMVRLID